MKRLLALLFFAQPLLAAPTLYNVQPVYSNVRFSIMKWGVLKEEGVFREFSGKLSYNPAAPQRSRIDVIVQAKSLDTKNDGRDGVVRSDDFLDVDRYPTLEFHSAGVEGTFVIGDLTIHGITRRLRLPVKSLGIREVPQVGRLAGFETAFTINRRDFGVSGQKWGAIPGTLGDEVEVHIIVGATAK